MYKNVKWIQAKQIHSLHSLSNAILHMQIISCISFFSSMKTEWNCTGNCIMSNCSVFFLSFPSQWNHRHVQITTIVQTLAPSLVQHTPGGTADEGSHCWHKQSLGLGSTVPQIQQRRVSPLSAAQFNSFSQNKLVKNSVRVVCIHNYNASTSMVPRKSRYCPSIVISHTGAHRCCQIWMQYSTFLNQGFLSIELSLSFIISSTDERLQISMDTFRENNLTMPGASYCTIRRGSKMFHHWTLTFPVVYYDFPCLPTADRWIWSYGLDVWRSWFKGDSVENWMSNWRGDFWPASNQSREFHCWIVTSWVQSSSNSVGIVCCWCPATLN